MIKRNAFLIVASLAVMVCCLLLGLNIFQAGLVAWIAVCGSYVVILVYMIKQRLNLINEKCDPQAFLEDIQKQITRRKNSVREKAYLQYSLAVGYYNLGEYEKAMESLKEMEHQNISRFRGILLPFTTIKLHCMYQAGEIEEAEKIYEHQFTALKPIGKLQRYSMEMVMAERLFCLERYKEAYEKSSVILVKNGPMIVKLAARYMMARCDEALGNIEAAKKSYGIVAEKGNKLEIARKAREKTAMLSGEEVV